MPGDDEMKRTIATAALLAALPLAAQAQTAYPTTAYPTTNYPGFYIGAEGGANWLLNNNSYVMDTGWVAGGKIGYDFLGPRVEVEGLYHSNTGSGVVLFPTGFANVRGRVDQVSVMGNLLYDFTAWGPLTASL
jgi:OmpA-OmpF porin, OOP family